MVALGTRFHQTDLSFSQMTGAAAEDADFTRALLVRSRLNGADLQRAVFTGADLQSADFTNARLDGAHFEGAINLPPSLRDRVKN
jgi:uncharacterized protein YjbI with pentapeptide repeats